MSLEFRSTRATKSRRKRPREVITSDTQHELDGALGDNCNLRGQLLKALIAEKLTAATRRKNNKLLKDNKRMNRKIIDLR